MHITAIPPWTPNGVLPPVNPDDPIGPDRSPYNVSLVDIVLRFSTSRERRQILDGLLRFRAELHAVGLVRGFQWVDGSFLEDIELLDNRPPKDVDVVTWVEYPADFAAGDRLTSLQDHDFVKREFLVDHYFVELSLLPPNQLISWSAYWYSMWSHRRSMQWKGFLQISLDPNEDLAAAKNLEEREGKEAAE